MSTIVSESPISSKTAGRVSYPWNEWLDGKKRLIVQGEDFVTSLEAMRTYVYRKAIERGLRAVVSVVPDSKTSLYIQTYRPEP